MSNAVRIICPSLACRALLAVPAAARGKTVLCSKCGVRVAVPAPSTATANSGKS